MSMTKEEVLNKMKEEGVVVLNVLPEAEFEKLHITGSHNVHLTQNYGAFFQEIERKYGKERSIITYGDYLSPSDGASAAQAMRVYGFKVENYPGGIQAWHAAGFPTEGTQSAQPAVTTV